jgi:ribosomal protein S18 acetylase RimI-like enzyme
VTPVSYTYRDMVTSDYEAVRNLWSDSGFTIRPITDSQDGIQRLLVRNPGLSVVALNGDQLVGCALGSHDGRRGFMQHVAVSPVQRGHGIAKRMIDVCLERFRALELGWVHLDVEDANDAAMSFWLKSGWTPRNNLTRLSLCLLD